MARPEQQFDTEDGAATPFQLVGMDGVLRPGIRPPMNDATVADALRLMLLTRTFDDKGMKLQRQGRFGTFSQVLGQEAAITGSAFALDPARDWVVPQYRELPALLRQGFPLEHFILYFTGNPAGGEVPAGVNCLPLNIALASQVPHAVGLGWGLRRQGRDSVVLVYFGDGASSEGDVHEALNLAGVTQAPVVFFLSNNGWAISTPRGLQSAARTLAARAIGYGMPGVVVDGNDLLAVNHVTTRAVARARAGLGPTLVEAVTYRVGAHNTADDPSRYVESAERDAWVERDPVERVRRYLTARGAWDDEQEAATAVRNRQLVDDALAAAATRPAPNADQLFEHLYASYPSRVQRQRAALTHPVKETFVPVLNMLDAIRAALTIELSRDERVLVIGQDVGRLGGVFRATDGLQALFGVDRVVDMPLAEAVIAGAALGLAVSGLRPVAEMQFLGFSHQAFHQIGPHIARMRYRSQGRFPVPVTIRAPFGGLVRTPEHHCDAIEAQFTQCPGLKVVMPATAYDAKGLLLSAIRDDDPVLFCEPLRGYRLIKDEVPDGDYTVEIGRARVVREGTDVTIIAWSAMVQTAERAAEQLAEQGIEAHVLDLRSLVPLDIDGLVAAVVRTGRVVVAHEAPLTAGFGAEVIATINEEAFYCLQAPICRVTAPDTPYPLGGVEDFYVPAAGDIVRAAIEVVRAVA